jgi:small subunit ribosomal protein S1
MADLPDSRPKPELPTPATPALPEPASDFAPSAEDAESAAEYEHLLEDFGHLEPVSEGELLSGHVVGISGKDVIVDVGLKMEGVVPIEQVTGPDGNLLYQIGDPIEVMSDRSGTTPEGFIYLSYEKASRRRIWDTLDRAMREQLDVSARVTARVKGGLEVDVGVPAFMPASQVDVRPTHNLDVFVGQDIPVKVLKLNRRRGNVVVSRKSAVEQEVNTRKHEILEHIEEGAVVQGVVKNLTDYGAFVDLGGIDGLLHVSDLSYGRVNHPSEMLQPGDTITVRVLKFDREKERISLGLKQLNSDPWESVEQRYLPGGRVIGRVVSVTDYGAFVELEPGVEGLIHISEMTWSRRMKHPSKVVKPNDNVECVVLEVKASEKRISLGMKQLEADPWTTIDQRYSVGSVVEGRVRKLTDFGCFIEIEEGIDGLVHISDLSWTKRLKHPSDMVKKGQVLQAVILNIDSGNRRLSLGVKQLLPDAFESFYNAHMVNDVVRGKVARMAPFGVFVELASGVEGLCHSSEIPGAAGERRGRGPAAAAPSDQPALPIGSEFDFKIIKMNEAERKIGLSLKAVADAEELSRIAEYQQRAAAATHSIEEVIQNRPVEEDSTNS